MFLVAMKLWSSNGAAPATIVLKSIPRLTTGSCSRPRGLTWTYGIPGGLGIFQFEDTRNGRLWQHSTPATACNHLAMVLSADMLHVALNSRYEQARSPSSFHTELRLPHTSMNASQANSLKYPPRQGVRCPLLCGWNMRQKPLVPGCHGDNRHGRWKPCAPFVED